MENRICHRGWVHHRFPALGRIAPAQDTDGKEMIGPADVGLPEGNRRTANPWEVRVYPLDDEGRIMRTNLSKFSKKYPIIVDDLLDKQYKLSDNEGAAYHGGVDLSSREDGERKPVPFKAGINGTVLRANGDTPMSSSKVQDGAIFILTPNGKLIQYLHASQVSVEPGQKVEPTTPLGMTGNTQTNGSKSGDIHLHIQATDGKKIIDVDKAFLEAKKPVPADLWKPVNWKLANWVDVDIPEPPVENGVVKATGKISFDDDQPAASDAVRLEGTTWASTTKFTSTPGSNTPLSVLNDPKYTEGWSVTFKADGIAEEVNRAGETRGTYTWKQYGNVVTVKGDTFDETGTISGSRISGKGANHRGWLWTWEAERIK